MRTCRGLQLRNWKAVLRLFNFLNVDKDLIRVIYNSWVMFKIARSFRPERSSIYVYILKNCSDLEGQRIYDDVYEQYTEQPYETTRDFYKSRYPNDSIQVRLMEYFYHEDPHWILPLSVFPRIDFEKSKMHYAFEDYTINPELLKEVHEKVFEYIMRLDIEEIFMPRGDVMQKYGTQRYNDGGIVRYDFERPKNSFDSSFKYQRFLTMPLTPREVWLPGKAIKQNNAFMMNIHRQILKRDPVYPSTDPLVNFSRIKPYLKKGFLKFDISGFGFQYVRELLTAGNRAIQELFPCSEYDEQTNIMEQILESVSVEMPNGDILYPKRGIGLGYYEDLKTIIMIALLQSSHPISIYGDQGLLDPFALEFAEELARFSFIMNWEKVDFGSSEGQTRWGGCIFNKENKAVIKPKLYMENILGAFFSRHHWERKLAIRGFAKHFPDVYVKIQNTVSDMYERTFGYEFYKSECRTSFDNGGLTLKPRNVGHLRLWNIRGYMSPVSAMVFDTTYQTPFKLAFDHKVSFKESKLFSKKRKAIYKSNGINDSTLYDYTNPVIVYNKKETILPRSLPKWADFNLIVYHSMSSGSLTCGLEGEEVKNAVVRQQFSSDPFRARATGGYSIDTLWRTSRPPDQEWLDVADVLMDLDKAHSLYVRRADLHQNPMLSDDPMYVDTNLFEHLITRIDKRKRSIHSDDHSELGARMSAEVRSILPSLIKRHKVNHLNDIVTLVEQRLGDFDKGYEVAESDYGDYIADESYYADAIDMVDLV